MNQKKYYPTAVALYITYFILGIAVTIMGQYKQSFAAMWGANQLADGSFDVSKVMAIIAAVGLGRLIAFPFAGPFSDKYGRRLSALVGVVFFAIFFIGITFTHSTVLAYILMICSGMANLLLWNWVYLLFDPYALQRLLYLRRHYTTIHRNTFQ